MIRFLVLTLPADPSTFDPVKAVRPITADRAIITPTNHPALGVFGMLGL